MVSNLSQSACWIFYDLDWMPVEGELQITSIGAKVVDHFMARGADIFTLTELEFQRLHHYPHACGGMYKKKVENLSPKAEQPWNDTLLIFS